MLLNESLEKFGLSTRETKVYLASLELGKATVQEIAKKSDLARSTSYSILEALISKKLIFPLKSEKIMSYSAEDPQKILNLSEESTRAIKSSLPELKKLYREASSRPKIKYHDGLNAIKEMYNDILRIKGLKEYLIFAPEDTWLQMDEKWITDFKARRVSAKIKTRIILNDSPESRQRLIDSGKYFSKMKILPPDITSELTAGVYIFYDKIILTDYKKDLISVEIQSKGIAQMQKLLFESLWKKLD